MSPVLAPAVRLDADLCNALVPPVAGCRAGGGLQVTIPPNFAALIAAGQDVVGCTYHRAENGTIYVSELAQLRLAIPALVNALTPSLQAEATIFSRELSGLVTQPGFRLAAHNWFRYNGRFDARLAADGTRFFAHNAHCEVVVTTRATFDGDFTVYVVPDNSVVDAAALTVFVDNVPQIVQFNVGAGRNTMQSAIIHTAATGVHTIRIQEGERVAGVFIVGLVIDGDVVPPIPISRQYTSYGDSVSMGAMSVPRSLGWVTRMRENSRFDGVTLLGRSGNSLSTTGGSPAARNILANEIVSSLIGSEENVLAMCLSINDWVPSADSTSAATFGASMGATLDTIKSTADAALIPGFKIMLHSMTHIATADAPNDKGSTRADFNSVLQAVAVARPAFVTYLDVYNAFTDADLADGFDHPNATGHQKLYAAVVAAT